MLLFRLQFFAVDIYEYSENNYKRDIGLWSKQHNVNFILDRLDQKATHTRRNKCWNRDSTVETGASVFCNRTEKLI